MSKKTKIIIAIVLLVLLVTPFVGYFMATSSEPFQYSMKAIQNAAVVKEVVGDVKSIKLSPFGYSVRYGGSQGWADFEAEVTGTKSSGALFVKLEKNLGTWQIVGAKLNGKEIKLQQKIGDEK